MNITKTNSLRYATIALSLLAFVIFAAACSDGGVGESSDATSAAGKSGDSAASLPSNLFTDAPLKGVASSLQELKKSAATGDEVTFLAVLGGRVDPFVKDRAVVQVTDVDTSTCYYGHCDAPWDACCTLQEDIVAGSATVQIVDTDGRPLKVDLRGVSELVAGAEVEINGVVDQSAEGTLIVNARRIHVISLDPPRWHPEEEG